MKFREHLDHHFYESLRVLYGDDFREHLSETDLTNLRNLFLAGAISVQEWRDVECLA